MAILAFAAVVGISMVTVISPSTVAVADPFYREPERFNGDPAQRLQVLGDFETTVQRDTFSAAPSPTPTPTPTPPPTETESSSESSSSSSSSSSAPSAGIPSPGTAQAIAYEMVVARGWADSEFDCLVSLWNRESGWRVNAENTSSGAYGIPQALPGNKMASAGSDWQTSASTQITWGLGYITGRYGSPCGAWAHSESVGWY